MAARTLMEQGMEHLLYPITAEWDEAAGAWSLLSPDFPEVASVATTPGDIAQQASDALATAIEARREDGEEVPAPTADVSALIGRWPPTGKSLLIHVPVPVGPLPPEPVRVAVSLDRPLLERIDQEASRRGMTRSGFLAEGARTLLGA